MPTKTDQPESMGLREAKNRFSEVTAGVNATGVPLVVTKNNQPWVIIEPADAASIERKRRRDLFFSLTRQIEGDQADEVPWDEGISDKELLGDERVRRFG